MEEFKGCDNCAYEHTDEGAYPCRMCAHAYFPNDHRRKMYSSKWTAKKDDEPTNSNVDHPIHYQGKVECIDQMIALFGVEAVKGFCKCNVYKYIFRADKKNGFEDIQKAEWYMDKLIELEGKSHDQD